MAKFLLGILTGILLTFFMAVFVVALIASLSPGQPSIQKDSILTMRLRGDIPEHAASEFSIQWLRHGPPPTLLDLRNALKEAADDERISALVLESGGLGTGWAKAQEIRYGIENFKKSGKPVVALLDNAGTIDYFVSSSADEIFMVPEAILDMKGLRAEVSFYADTLEKLGIEAEVERIGKYKSAAEPFSRSSMSDEYREVVNSVLDDLYTRFIATVAKSREKPDDAFRALLDEGPFLSSDAVEAGLIDGLKYEDQFRDYVKEKLEQEEWREVTFSAYRKPLESATGFGGGDQIAVVYAVGDIMSGNSEVDPFLDARILGDESFAKTLREVREKDDVKAVILRVNSPGGDAFASDRMWREVNLLREKKPLVVSMSNVAASGGYYISMAQAPVVAYPGTFTGSIGVIYGKMNLRGLYDKIGVKERDSHAGLVSPPSIATTAHSPGKNAQSCGTKSRRCTRLSCRKWPTHGNAHGTRSRRSRRGGSGSAIRHTKRDWSTSSAGSTGPSSWRSKQPSCRTESTAWFPTLLRSN